MPALLVSWQPGSGAEESQVVDSVEGVTAAAEQLLARYQSAGDALPGLELRSDENGRLAIALAPFGWALIHTDDEFNQHCTEAESAVSGEALQVRWDELTSVPRRWFVPSGTASNGVQQWLDDGTLSPNLRWSNHCF